MVVKSKRSHKTPKVTDQQKLAKLLGIEAPPVDPYEDSETISREAEAAIAYHEQPQAFIRKECGTCGGVFVHTRGAVGFCSDYCRAVSLEKIGIKWHWLKKSEDRWGRTEPLVAGVTATKLVDEVNPKVDHLKCPNYNHMRDTPEHGAWCWDDCPVPEGIKLVTYRDDTYVQYPFPNDPPAVPETSGEWPVPSTLPGKMPEPPSPESPTEQPVSDDEVDVLDLLSELGLA